MELYIMYGVILYVWSYILCMELYIMYGVISYVWICMDIYYMYGVILYIWSYIWSHVWGDRQLAGIEVHGRVAIVCRRNLPSAIKSRTLFPASASHSSANANTGECSFCYSEADRA
jgi:hypothetical protein